MARPLRLIIDGVRVDERTVCARCGRNVVGEGHNYLVFQVLDGEVVCTYCEGLPPGGTGQTLMLLPLRWASAIDGQRGALAECPTIVKWPGGTPKWRSWPDE